MATPQTQRTVADVLQHVVANIQQIIRDEFRLAKTELKEKATQASKPASILATGMVLGLYALGFLLLAAVYALSMVMPHWRAALLVMCSSISSALSPIAHSPLPFALFSAVPARFVSGQGLPN